MIALAVIAFCWIVAGTAAALWVIGATFTPTPSREQELNEILAEMGEPPATADELLALWGRDS